MQQLLASAFPQDLKGALTLGLKTSGTDSNAQCPTDKYLLIVSQKSSILPLKGCGMNKKMEQIH